MHGAGRQGRIIKGMEFSAAKGVSNIANRPRPGIPSLGHRLGAPSRLEPQTDQTILSRQGTMPSGIIAVYDPAGACQRCNAAKPQKIKKFHIVWPPSYILDFLWRLRGVPSSDSSPLASRPGL